MDMEVQVMVEAQVLEDMKATEVMEAERDRVTMVARVVQEAMEAQVVMEVKEAQQDGMTDIHSLMVNLGTIYLHITMRGMDQFIVETMLDGHKRRCKQGILNGIPSYRKLW